MKTVVSIPVDAELAEKYQRASAEEQQTINTLFETLLRRMIAPSRRSLTEMMNDISDQAQVHGLSSDILDDMLQTRH